MNESKKFHTFVTIEEYTDTPDSHTADGCWDDWKRLCFGKDDYDHTPAMSEIIMWFANRVFGAGQAELAAALIAEGDIERYRITIYDATKTTSGEGFPRYEMVDRAEIDDTTLYDYLTSPDHAADREKHYNR